MLHTHARTHRNTQIRVCPETQALKGTSATSMRVRTRRRRAKDISLSPDPTLSPTGRQRRRHVRSDASAAPRLSGCALVSVRAAASSSLPVRAYICKFRLRAHTPLTCKPPSPIRTGSKQRRHSSFWLFYLTVFEIHAPGGGGGGGGASDAAHISLDEARRALRGDAPSQFNRGGNPSPSPPRLGDQGGGRGLLCKHTCPRWLRARCVAANKCSDFLLFMKN